MSVLDISHLSFAYDTTAILKDVTFSVEAGTFVALCGPNGGGKSTLLQLIMGFLKPSQGNLLLWGHPPKESRKKIAWVPQVFHFDRNFPISVKEVVLTGRLRHLSGWGYFPKREILLAEEALARVGLTSLLHQPFTSLSGGQMQRVLIARALATQPALLLLDEPTASVDPQAQSAIYSLLEELRGKLTIIMVTHHVHQAVKQADRLLCIEKTVTEMNKQQVCAHFSVGLYHTLGPS